MMSPNEGFVNSLHAIDPLLDVRWGDHVGRWVIERKAYITDTELWFLTRRFARRGEWLRKETDLNKIAKLQSEFNEIGEELRSAKANKRVVLMPKVLNDQCFNALGIMDIHRWGGYSRMADEMERRESFAEQDQDRQMANEREALHKHVYDILDFAWRKRSTQLANGDHLRKPLKEIIGTSEL